MPRNTNPETVQSFMQRAADQLVLVATARTMRDGGLSSALAGAGITGDIAASGSGPVTVTVKVDENHGLPKGATRDQYKETALAEFDRKALNAAKQRVWDQIRYLTGNGSIDGDKALELLDALGYGAASKPTAKTTATVTIPARRKDGHDSRHITLDGSFTKDEIRDSVVEALGSDAGLRADTVLAMAFGDKLTGGLNELVTVSDHQVRTVWPAKSEFAGE